MFSATGAISSSSGERSTSAGEVPGLGDVLVDQPAELVGAVLLQVHPGLERPEPARELHAVVAEPEAGVEPALAVHEVVGVSEKVCRCAAASRTSTTPIS